MGGIVGARRCGARLPALGRVCAHVCVLAQRTPGWPQQLTEVAGVLGHPRHGLLHAARPNVHAAAAAAAVGTAAEVCALLQPLQPLQHDLVHGGQGRCLVIGRSRLRLLLPQATPSCVIRSCSARGQRGAAAAGRGAAVRGLRRLRRAPAHGLALPAGPAVGVRPASALRAAITGRAARAHGRSRGRAAAAGASAATGLVVLGPGSGARERGQGLGGVVTHTAGCFQGQRAGCVCMRCQGPAGHQATCLVGSCSPAAAGR